MHFYYCAGINSQSFAGAGGSGQKFSGSGRERDEENSPAQGSTSELSESVDNIVTMNTAVSIGLSLKVCFLKSFTMLTCIIFVLKY